MQKGTGYDMFAPWPSGRPVIAYGRGGALETVVNGKTGLLFREQTVEALVAAVEEMEKIHLQFESEILRQHAEAFSKAVFIQRIQQEIFRVFAEQAMPTDRSDWAGQRRSEFVGFQGRSLP